MKIFSTIICLFVYTMVLATSPNASQQAILIGIDYSTEESRATPSVSAVSCVQELARILSRNGYECRILTDREASKEQINEVFIQLEQKVYQSIEPDVFLFYFSGRSTTIPDDILADEIQDGMDECILPFDAQPGNNLSFIRDDTLARWISAIKAKKH